MGFIAIDPSLNLAEEVAQFFNALIVSSSISFPIVTIPQILIAKSRMGLDSNVTTATILSRFPEAPIPNGPLDGSNPNSMEIFAKIIVEEIFLAIQNNMRVDVEIDPGMLVESTGASAAGPVAVTGVNASPWTGTGVAS